MEFSYFKSQFPKLIEDNRSLVLGNSVLIIQNPVDRKHFSFLNLYFIA